MHPGELIGKNGPLVSVYSQITTMLVILHKQLDQNPEVSEFLWTMYIQYKILKIWSVNK